MALSEEISMFYLYFFAKKGIIVRMFNLSIYK